MTRALLITAALFAFIAPGLGAQATAVAATGSLNPGDQVRIVVWRKPELSGDFPIAANGTIIHPLYREVQVTGIPISAVEDRLRTFLGRYEANPQFVVQPLVKIVVAGEVRAPNIFTVPPETTVAQAIAMAGGPTDRGLLNQVRLVRERQVIAVDISRPESEASLVQIRSGDEILVGRRSTPAREYLGPIASGIAAAAAIASIFIK